MGRETGGEISRYMIHEVQASFIERKGIEWKGQKVISEEFSYGVECRHHMLPRNWRVKW